MVKEKKVSKRITEKYQREIMGAEEPKGIDKERYKVELMLALNYYNVNVDDKVKRKWVMDYVKKNDKSKVPLISDLPDYAFHSIGAIVRMINLGFDLQQNELDFVKTRLEKMVEMQQLQKIKESKKSSETLVKVPNIQDKMAQKAIELYNDFSLKVDEYLTKNGELPNLQEMLLQQGISKQVALHLPKMFKTQINELNEYLEGDDEQLFEGYSYTTEARVKRLVMVLENMDNLIKSHGVKVRVSKPRAAKVKSPIILVKNVKYLNRDDELGLVSINPVEIIGATDVWTYNVKSKKLVHYMGSNISVRGTTLTNFEVDDSSSKTFRKPETLKEFITQTKKKMEIQFREIKAVKGIPNGRINKDTIILKAFK